MRPPHHLISNRFFLFSKPDELVAALGNLAKKEEIEEIKRLVDLGLPPVTSINALAAMFGFNPGFVWSLVSKADKYYRRFEIPKGRGVRVVHAPRVGLKLLQKWIALRLSDFWVPPAHVFGFVSGRSHVGAAEQHCGAQWVFSCDIENFFPSTTNDLVVSALCRIGYGLASAQLIAGFCCYSGGLAQGSPASPVLSNICFSALDDKLLAVSVAYGCSFTRYADDVVFSGQGDFPENLPSSVFGCFEGEVWRIAPGKTSIAALPGRLKVHGLLVHGERPRLTKGYRNKLRAYRHLLENDRIFRDESSIKGHLAYGDYVQRKVLI